MKTELDMAIWVMNIVTPEGARDQFELIVRELIERDKTIDKLCQELAKCKNK